ncbi:MAG: hypothetical protein FWH27_09115 [Planctomycetaceae bacterium]|nr:hypothetical protein [Planctomycetaceae bacterium]
MRHKILGIIVACLALAGSVAPAQEIRGQATVTTPDGRVITFSEEEQRQMFAEHGLTVDDLQRQFDEAKEIQRLIDAGEVTILDPDNMEPPILHPPSFSGDFDPMEELQLQIEQGRQKEDEFLRQVFNEIGISETETEPFSTMITGIEKSYMQIAEKYEDYFDQVTSESYVEFAEFGFDRILQPLFSDMRSEAANFLGEDQYNQLAVRYHQVMDLGGLGGFGRLPHIDTEREIFKMFLLPDVIGMTGDQLDDFARFQKEFFTELIGMGTALEDELQRLRDEDALLSMQLANKDELYVEQTAIKDRQNKIQVEKERVREETIRQFLTKQKSKLNALLTPEQKARLAQIQADIPDYMKKALGGVTTGDTDESTVAWRPGVNSWMPGMGAPRDREGTNREAPRVREPRGERRFPGSE